MSAQPHVLENVYVSLDVHEDANGLYYTEYAQWDTTCAVRVWPMDYETDPKTGVRAPRPKAHGEPLMSIMTRMDMRDRLPEMIRFLLAHV